MYLDRKVVFLVGCSLHEKREDGENGFDDEEETLGPDDNDREGDNEEGTDP